MPAGSLGPFLVLAFALVAFGGGLTRSSTGGFSSCSLNDGEGLLAVGRAVFERSSRARSLRASASMDAERSVAASVACLAIESSVAEKSTADPTSGEQQLQQAPQDVLWAHLSQYRRIHPEAQPLLRDRPLANPDRDQGSLGPKLLNPELLPRSPTGPRPLFTTTLNVGCS